MAIREHGMSALSAFTYASAAILGVIASNYVVDVVGTSPYYMLGAGAVLFALPVFFLHESTGMMGPVRLFLAVTGLTLVVRSLIGNGTTIPGLLGTVQLPAEVGAVV